jgi:hypothetical protein
MKQAWWAALALSIGLTAGGTQAQTAALQDETRFAEAVQLYRAGRWSGAYGRFIKLADQGHPGAARIALLMLRHGRDLYQTEWTAAPSQVAHWERVSGPNGAFQLVNAAE